MRAFLTRPRIFELLEDRCVRASLSGSVFIDDSTSLPRSTIQGALVWIDQDSNQILDDGDLKSWTDASGEYHFQNLPIGNYEVRLRPPAGTFQTSPQQFFGLQVGTIHCKDWMSTLMG
jgi:hypothetical protein